MEIRSTKFNMCKMCMASMRSCLCARFFLCSLQ